MQAYYEIETNLPVDHQLTLKLPDDIPAGRIKVAIICDLPKKSVPKNKLMADFLDSLPEPKTQGLSREQIQAYMDEERASWDD